MELRCWHFIFSTIVIYRFSSIADISNNRWQLPHLLILKCILFTESLKNQNHFRMPHMLIFSILLGKHCLCVSVFIWFGFVLRNHYLILQGIPIFSNCHRKRGGPEQNKEGYCDRWNITHNEYSFHPALSSRGLLPSWIWWQNVWADFINI